MRQFLPINLNLSPTKIFTAMVLVAFIGINLFPLTVLAVSRPESYDQEHYWWLDDDGTTINNATGYSSPDTSTDTAIQDVPVSGSADLRLRLAIYQSVSNNNVSSSVTPQLQYSSDATSCTTGSWTNVPTATAATTQAFKQATSGNFADGDAATQRFSDGHAFQSGGDGVETDGTADSIVWPASTAAHTEWEWMLNVTTNATSNTTYRFRAFNNASGAVLNAYSQCAQLATAAVFSLEQVSYRWRNDNGGEVAGAASAGFVNPNGDFSVGWATTVPSGTHYTTIDEGATPDTADYIDTGNQGTDEFDMETATGGTTYNRVDVLIHGSTAGNDQIGVNLVINGTPQTEQTFTPAGSWTTVSFTGLSMSQADLDGLRARVRHAKVAGTDSVRINTLRAEVFREVSAATFKQSENTVHTGQAKNENVRLRALVKNNGPDSAGSRDYRIQYAGKGAGTCAAPSGTPSTYTDVPNASAEAIMTTSTEFADQDATQNISPGIADPAGTFVAGKLVEATSNQATAITLANGEFTELEYNFQFTSTATDGARYCFRATRSGTAFTTYNYGEIELAGGGGAETPTTEQLLRHGNWFNSSGVEQSFYWAQ